jgi:ribosomal protein S18 acetylase RimI-like enzyme
MAALSESMARGLEIVELRHLVGRELDPLLLEETVEWQRELDWDFARSADLVRQFADARALTGVALLDQGEVAGYGYSIIEEQKGLIGDVYVRPAWRRGDAELRVLRMLFDGLTASTQVRRIESQLMMIDPAVGRALQRERPLKIQDRVLMHLDCGEAPVMPVGAAQRKFHIEPWADHHHELAASVISLAYHDHIDSQINDQYRTVAGARRFIYNIVQFPGCGTFFRPASFVAFDLESGWMTGVALVSFVDDEVGHITQLCVIPRAKGRGLGYELLRQSINTLRSHGAKRISLTVTSANTEAIQLYERCGFRAVRAFNAYTWERP